MRILTRQFSRGLLCGAVLGFLAGAAGMAAAAPGKKIWDQFGDKFQAGYITGFLDCLRIGRAYDPGGYLETTFPLPTAAATGRHWVVTINKLFEEERHQKRELPQMMVFAGQELQKEFGAASAVKGHVGLSALRKVFEARRKARLEERKKQAAAAGETKGVGKDEPAATDEAKKGGKGEKAVEGKPGEEAE